MTEQVDHPSYYNQGPLDPDGTAKYECIKIVEDWSLGFKLGNALKYILRAPHKGSEKEDLAKARWYLERACHYPDPDAIGARFLSPTAVCDAWGLTGSLADAVHSIGRGYGASDALAALDAHLVAKAEP